MKYIKNKQIINRKSYKSLNWLCKSIFLNFKIYDDVTIINSKLIFYKNKNSKNWKSLQLNGNKLSTLKFEINFIYKNNKNKSINLKPYNDLLVLDVPKECTKIIIKNSVKTNPKKNLSLEGLYETNNMLCTQCEPEGFRKITWFPDRPDNLSVFTVRIETKNDYKYRLSNGNIIRTGKTNEKNRKYTIWNDPFPKPSYLFALVVGNLDILQEKYVTNDNRVISLEIYTEIGKAKDANFAMSSLKKAIKWDEDNYGLTYDLDKFMIVAVDHFNMGAMENKGLNIFNSKFILSDPSKSTFQDYINIESIVAHEYFHNWTGNRVTCRDWFQLTLKEGLTVFRDQQFSSDLRNSDEKRIKDVLFLKSNQFAEDNSPNRHSIRPEKYLEINNFYTSTVYEKGAEFIRMISNYIGNDKFKKGVKFFLKKFDGQAVTCEDFLQSIEKYSNINLSQFYKWYAQKGTIMLNVKRSYNERNGILLEFCQKNKFSRTVVPIPVKICFFDKFGKKNKFYYKNKNKYEHNLIVDKKNKKFFFPKIKNNCIPSLLRDFSAPVNLKTDFKIKEHIHLLKFDDNLFKKWDTCQFLHLKQLKGFNLNAFSNVVSEIINKKNIDKSLIALLLTPPSYINFQNFFCNYDPLELYINRKKYLISFYKKIENDLMMLLKYGLEDLNKANSDNEKSLIKIVLSALCSIKNETALILAEKFSNSYNDNMEIKTIGLQVCIENNHHNSINLLNKFYFEFNDDKLVLEKWFKIISSYNNIYFNGIKSIKEVLKNKKFEYKNPNLVRAVIGSFLNNNIELLHALDESGYKFFAEQVILIDEINPQTASRILLPMTNISRFNKLSQTRIKKYLNYILNKKPSNDVFEVLNKALN